MPHSKKMDSFAHLAGPCLQDAMVDRRWMEIVCNNILPFLTIGEQIYFCLRHLTFIKSGLSMGSFQAKI